jgi:hypothetical protein
MTLVSVAIQVDEPQLRNVLTLNILSDYGNVTFTPLNSSGDVIVDALVITWAMVQPYVVWTIKSNGSQLPSCDESIGCDGFSVPIEDLVMLSPARGYRIAVFYRVTLPPSISSSSPARRLLYVLPPASAIGVSAFSSNAFDIQLSWFVLPFSSSSTATAYAPAPKSCEGIDRNTFEGIGDIGGQFQTVD